LSPDSLSHTRQVEAQEDASLFDTLSDVFHESILGLLAPKSLVMLSMVSRKGKALVDDECPTEISKSLW